MKITQVIRWTSQLFFSWKMSWLLVVLHQPASGPRPQHRADLLVAAVDVAAVDEGRDGVDLFPARLPTGWTRTREVYTGYTRILSHWE